MQFKPVTITAGSVDFVKGKGKIGLTIRMEDLLEQRNRIAEWAEEEVPLVITIEPMQPPLPGISLPRQVPAEAAR